MTLTAEQNELLDLRDKVQDQAEEILQLKQQLLGTDNAMPAEWCLTPAEEKIVACLFAARGAVRTREQLFHAFADAESEVDIKIVDVHISRIRKKLVRFNVHVKTVWGTGYQLDSAALRAVGSALGEHAPPAADGLVSAIIVAWGSRQFTTDDIARHTGLAESSVARILNAWKEATVDRAAQHVAGMRRE